MNQAAEPQATAAEETNAANAAAANAAAANEAAEGCDAANAAAEDSDGAAESAEEKIEEPAIETLLEQANPTIKRHATASSTLKYLLYFLIFLSIL